MKYILPLLLIMPLTSMAQGICNPDANVIIYANYDGGTLNINVDEDVPNLRIGICSYEPITVNLSGACVGNVSEVVWAGYTIAGTAVNGVDAGMVELQQYPAATLSDPDGYSYIICAYDCDTTFVPGGCNTVDQVTEYFLSYFEGSLRYSQLQYGVWGSSSFNISDGGNCCFTTGCTAQLTTSENTTICAGNEIILTASGAETYTWTVNGDDIECDAPCGELTVSPEENSTYTVTGTDDIGCVGTEEIYILVNPAPEIELVFDGETIYASGGVYYSWWLNGEPLSEGASNTLIPTEPGDYYAIGVGVNDCSGLSNTIVVGETNIGEPAGLTSFTLFPNPAAQFCTVNFGDSGTIHLVQLLDVSGRCLFEKICPPGMPTCPISLEGFPPQCLFVSVGENGLVTTLPVIHTGH